MTNPTVVVAGRIQDFRGERYYWNGKYFQRKGKRLHRAVYEAWHGEPVRQGWQVRPRNGDYGNCAIRNLDLVRGTAHY